VARLHEFLWRASDVVRKDVPEGAVLPLQREKLLLEPLNFIKEIVIERRVLHVGNNQGNVGEHGREPMRANELSVLDELVSTLAQYQLLGVFEKGVRFHEVAKPAQAENGSLAARKRCVLVLGSAR
jgi:hypothetical protein